MQVAELESQGAHDSSSENNKEELSQTLEELELLIKAKDEVILPQSRGKPESGWAVSHQRPVLYSLSEI